MSRNLMPEVVHAAGIDVVRGGRYLLRDINFTVHHGEHWALLGPNGAGKSTLLHILGAFGHPTRGTVDVLGHRPGRVDMRELRTHIGYVHHLEDLPISTSHALLLRDGETVIQGRVDESLTSATITKTFDHPVLVTRNAGRWAARS